MSHYYQFDNSLKSNKRALELFIDDVCLRFTSDLGVFSNKEIDFGSFMLIKEIKKQPSVSKTLDVGCGYGVIGLTLKYFNKTEIVDMVDINPRAIELTLENQKNLQLKNVNAFISDCLYGVSGCYDRIVINPPIRAGKKVIYTMFEQSYDHLIENGQLWIVIKKDLGAPSALKKLESLNFQTKITLKHKGYWIIQAIK